MNTNYEDQIRVDPSVFVLDFIHAKRQPRERDRRDGLVGETVAAVTPLARRSAAKTAQRVGKRKRLPENVHRI
jgi:hypothetical protein